MVNSGQAIGSHMAIFETNHQTVERLRFGLLEITTEYLLEPLLSELNGESTGNIRKPSLMGENSMAYAFHFFPVDFPVGFH